MKTLKPFLTFIMLMFVIWSCKEELVKATLKGTISPNELQAPTASPYVLVKENKGNVLETFKWTVTDFGFNASVNYTLQAAAAGTSFANAADVASTSSRQLAVTVGDFNDIMLAVGLTPEQAGDVDLRVRSIVSSDTIYSNTRTITVTDYATSFPPIWGMGAALKGWGPWPGGTDASKEVEWQSTEFRKYSTITYFTHGETFRWFGQLDWSPVAYNYPFFTTVSDIFENANDGDLNLRVAGETGWYQVDVDLNAKTVGAVAVDEPQLYMMGDGLNGWGPWHDKEIKMTYIKPGVFEAQPNFIAGIFRFFAQADWAPTSYNFNYFTSVDANFILNAPDGDNNLKFVGTPGILHIVVDLNAKTVVITHDPTLFMMGDALNGWGPWNDKEIQMTFVSGHEFTATTTFTNGLGAFRFFPQRDWGPDSYNYLYFTTVDADFVNANDGDKNLKYMGTTGIRTIHVNVTAKTVSLD